MDSDDDLAFRQRLRTMQIIAAALILGVLLMLGVMVPLRLTNPPAAVPTDQMISTIALVSLCAMVIAALVLPNALLRTHLQQIVQGKWQPPPRMNPQSFQGDLAKLLVIRQAMTLIVLALLESAAMLGVIAFFIEGEPWVLGVVGAAVAIMLANFPRADGVRAWLQHRLQELEDLRQSM